MIHAVPKIREKSTHAGKRGKFMHAKMWRYGLRWKSHSNQSSYMEFDWLVAEIRDKKILYYTPQFFFFEFGIRAWRQM